MRRRVLICDDAMFMRTVIANVLTRAGFTVVGQAGNGAEAVAQYRELRPDLVTMDVVMPERSGIDAVREIVAVDADARIVVCSAMGQEHLIAQARAAGARGFITKPFDASTLLAEVEGALADPAPAGSH